MSSVEEMTDAACVDVWRDFITAYKEPNRLNFYYMDKLVNMRRDNKRLFILNYDHLCDYNLNQINENFTGLRYMTAHNPDMAKRTLRAAVLLKLKEIQPEYAMEIDRDFHVELSNAHLEKEIPDLNVADCGKLLKITGIMTTRDEVSAAKTHYTVWVCEFGHKTKLTGSDRPKKCKGTVKSFITEEEGDSEIEEGCESVKFFKDEKNSYSEDYIRFDLQQRSEKTKEALTPASIKVEVVGADNVAWAKDNLAFGENISVTCIPRTRPTKYTTGQGSVISDIYLESSTVEVLPEHYFEREPDPTLDQIVEDTIRHDLDPVKNAKLEEAGLQKLIASICPSLYMSNTLMKELILMWLVGSDALKSPDGTRVRGEGHLFLLGDPGMGKTHITEFIKLCRERVFYNSSGKTSSVGLVGGLIHDKDGVGRISPGVFGLAKNGVVILDEFAGRTDADYANMLEPLGDQQTVTIHKGGQFRETRINTAVLAIANPSTPSKYYNPKKSLYENTEIPITILQRMDTTLIIQDVVNKEEDRAKVKWYFENLAKSVTEEEFYRERPDKFKRRKEDIYGVEYLKRWIVMVRDKYHPRVDKSPEAIKVIEDWYMRVRGMRITISEEGPKSATEEVTISAGNMRELGSVRRYAQMHARACQREYVTKEDAERACFYMDITLAEAGWWRQNADGSRHYEKDNLTEARKKQEGEWEARYRRKFAKELQKASFIKCFDCHGHGRRVEIGGDPVLCVNCNAVGYTPCKFSKVAMIVDCVGTEGGDRMDQKSFNSIWADYEKKSQIVPHEDGEHYRNLMPWEGTAPSSKQTSKERLKQQTMREHPGIWKRFARDSNLEDMR